MSRATTVLREVTADDLDALADLWRDVLRGCDEATHRDDLEQVLKRVATATDERIVVAEVDGRAVGAVHLRVTAVSPINLEQVVQAVSPTVLAAYQRQGIGRMLMEAAVSYAEECGVGYLATASLSSSRDANRFMARLALGPQAMLRVAATQTVRAKLTAQRPQRVGRRGAPNRQIGQVLAQRRSLRRQQSTHVG